MIVCEREKALQTMPLLEKSFYHTALRKMAAFDTPRQELLLRYITPNTGEQGEKLRDISESVSRNFCFEITL